MKQLLVGFSLFLSVLSMNAQKDFFGEHAELYKGCELQLKSKDNPSGHYSFKSDISHDHSFGVVVNSFITSNLGADLYKSYDGLVFTCNDVINTDDVVYKKQHILKLFNEKTGAVYFKYDEDDKNNFPFELKSEVIIPNGYFNNDISSSLDKFKDKIIYNTPLLDNISFYKVVKNGKADYFVNIAIVGTLSDAGKGVMIFFEDGSKIIKKEFETRVRVNSNADYEHSVYFGLNKDEIDQIASVEMTEVRIHLYDIEIRMPFKYKGYINCLIKK